LSSGAGPAGTARCQNSSLRLE